ncbi:MAG: ABC transporter transmembrane domain-containing protein [Evtepia gabavorous]
MPNKWRKRRTTTTHENLSAIFEALPGLCLLTLLVMALDVAGALYLPTIVADMINIGVAGGDLDFILRKGGLMLGVALVSGGGTLMGCFLCARLSARIGRDMRNALYDKSLTFSASDFEGFGTGSMITRTLNDVNVVQQAFVWSVQMVLPVPLMCVIGVLMAFPSTTSWGCCSSASPWW